MAEVVAGAAEGTGVEVVVVAVVMSVVVEKDVVEWAMVKIHMDFLASTEYLWQSTVYTLHSNEDSSACNKIIIFLKKKIRE